MVVRGWCSGVGGRAAMAMPGEVARGPRLQMGTKGVPCDVASDGDVDGGGENAPVDRERKTWPGKMPETLWGPFCMLQILALCPCPPSATLKNQACCYGGGETRGPHWFVGQGDGGPIYENQRPLAGPLPMLEYLRGVAVFRREEAAEGPVLVMVVAGL